MLFPKVRLLAQFGVFSELRKLCSFSLKPYSIWMYRDAQQAEIDFLVQSEGRTHAIECKWNEIPKQADLSAISDLMSYLSKKPTPSLNKVLGYLVCRTPEIHPFPNGMKAVPLTELGSILI